MLDLDRDILPTLERMEKDGKTLPEAMEWLRKRVKEHQLVMAQLALGEAGVLGAPGSGTGRDLRSSLAVNWNPKEHAERPRTRMSSPFNAPE